MYPAESMPEATFDDAGMYFSFPFAGTYRREYLEQYVVQHIGDFFLKINFPLRLDPANLVHHARAIDHLKLRQGR